MMLESVLACSCSIVAVYIRFGSDAEDVLRAVDRKMYSKKHKLTPVF